MSDKSVVFCVVGFLLIIVTIGTFGVIKGNEPVTASTGIGVPRRELDIYEQGAHARRNGVPANANPYAVAHCSSEAATWLNGWIDAKE